MEASTEKCNGQNLPGRYWYVNMNVYG